MKPIKKSSTGKIFYQLLWIYLFIYINYFSFYYLKLNKLYLINKSIFLLRFGTLAQQGVNIIGYELNPE